MARQLMTSTGQAVLRPPAPANLGTTFLLIEVALVATLVATGGSLGVMVAIVAIVGIAAFWTKRTTTTTEAADLKFADFARSLLQQFKAWGFGRKPSGRDILWTVIVLAGLAAVAVVYTAMFAGSSAVDSVTAGRGVAVAGGAGLLAQVLMVIFAVVLVPLLEEIGWRGYVLSGSRALLDRLRLPIWAAPTIALLGSSVLFGLSHWQYDSHGQILTAITGLAYGLVFMATQNIALSVSAHAAWNLLWVLSVIAA